MSELKNNGIMISITEISSKTIVKEVNAGGVYKEYVGDGKMVSIEVKMEDVDGKMVSIEVKMEDGSDVPTSTKEIGCKGIRVNGTWFILVGKEGQNYLENLWNSL